MMFSVSSWGGVHPKVMHKKVFIYISEASSLNIAKGKQELTDDFRSSSTHPQQRTITDSCLALYWAASPHNQMGIDVSLTFPMGDPAD